MERIPKENVENILPLTPFQSTLLLSYLAEPNGSHYKEITRYRLQGKMTIAQIADAINKVVSEHEMLRTIFRWENLREPVQIVLKEVSIPIEQYDIQETEKALQDAKVEELEQKSFEIPLDICKNPLKFIIFQLEEEVYEVTIINHHILFDGWSNSILLEDIYQTLCQLIENRPVYYPKKAQLEEYLQFLKRQDKREDLDFWETYLEGFRKKTILPKIHRYAAFQNQERLLTHQEDSALYDEVRTYAANLSVSYAAVFYAAWGILYYKENGQRDIVFGTPVDGRPPEVPGINHTIGLFMNTIPLRITIEESETIETYIRRVYSNMLKIREHQYIPYAQIAAKRQVKPTGTLFDSIIVIQNYPVDTSLLAGKDAVTMSLRTRKITTGARLTIEIRTFGGFFIDISYQEQYYKEESIKKLVNEYKEVLEDMMQKKNSTLSEILNRNQDNGCWNMLQVGGECYDDF
mgnify:CR=1 FL=1